MSFRATCTKCLAWLHVCKNCIYYKPGMSNDCQIPGTELIADREMANFCEDFKVLGKAPPTRLDPLEIAKKLFKEP